MGIDISASPKEQLIANLRETIKSVENRIKENESIISQNQLEVDRLQQQNVSLSTQLKRVEDSFSTLPREDIRAVYEKALDFRSRLVTMRSQLEKLQVAQTYLVEYRDKLEEVLASLGGVEMARLGPGAGEVTGYQIPLSGQQVIRLVEAQELELKRLATALHDGPVQSLNNFILQAEICRHWFDRDPDNARNELNNLKSSASVVFNKTREYIFELRPMMLDDLGLVATIKRHVENYSQKYSDKKFQFQMTGPGDVRRFPAHVETMMFRSFQLLLNTALGALKARSVALKLDIDDSRLFGTVEDDGRSIDLETELDPGQSDSDLRSLIDLQERLEMLGGTLQVYPNAAGGNVIEIHLPYERGES
jgi:two-component system sensor histidine kinase DegS